jgi:hypothetical protein
MKKTMKNWIRIGRNLSDFEIGATRLEVLDSRAYINQNGMDPSTSSL